MSRLHRPPSYLAATAAVLILLVSTCSAEEGAMSCSSKDVVSDFNATAYMGTWYEYGKTGSMPYEANGICVSADYTLSDNNVTVVNTMKDNRTHETSSLTGWANFTQGQHEGKLSVHIGHDVSVTADNYWVLDTDYNSYSIVWSCLQHDNGTVDEKSWILTRMRKPSNETIEKVEDFVKNNMKTYVLMSNYSLTEQSEELCSGTSRLMGAFLSILFASMLIRLH